MGVLHALPISSLQPDSLSVNQVIRSTQSWQRATHLFWKFGCGDVIGINSALGALKEGGRWDDAIALLQFSALRRLQPDVISSTEITSTLSYEQKGFACGFIAVGFGSVYAEAHCRDVISGHLFWQFCPAGLVYVPLLLPSLELSFHDFSSSYLHSCHLLHQLCTKGAYTRRTRFSLSLSFVFLCKKL